MNAQTAPQTSRVYYPYIPCEHMEVVQQIKANWLQIRAESDAMFANTHVDDKPNWVLAPNRNRMPSEDGQTMYKGRNISAHLRIVEELLVPKEIELCRTPGADERRAYRRQINPTLMSILEPLIDTVGNIGFNQLHPEGKIAPHYGVSTRYFRVHLGLHCDDGAQFFIEGGDPYTWKNGEIMAFADGHWLHWVEHNGQKPRTILAVDFLKSSLGWAEALIPPRVI